MIPALYQQQTSLQNDLPGEFSQTGWQCDEDIPYDQWEYLAQSLQAISGSLNWIVGDVLNYGNHKYGEKYAQAVDVLGWAVQRAKDACWVAGSVLSENRNPNLSWTAHRHVAHLKPDQQKYWLDLAEETGASSAELFQAIKAAGLNKRDGWQALTLSESNEYYTPAEILADARALLGGIDLDPASCETANKVVGARYYYTEEQDGLAMPWDIGGKPVTVWLNPPYGFREGKSNQELWSTRMTGAYEAGIISGGLLLVNAATGAGWFGPLWDYPICFVGYRIHFVLPTGEVSGNPTHDNAIVYFGGDEQEFVARFSKYGAVVKALA